MSESSRLRKHLNADVLFKALHNDFLNVSDFRQGNIEISMADALISGFAMFFSRIRHCWLLMKEEELIKT